MAQVPNNPTNSFNIMGLLRQKKRAARLKRTQQSLSTLEERLCEVPDGVDPKWRLFEVPTAQMNIFLSSTPNQTLDGTLMCSFYVEWTLTIVQQAMQQIRLLGSCGQLQTLDLATKGGGLQD